MSDKSLEHRLARRAFDKMVWRSILCPQTGRGKVGALLEKLNPKEGEDIKNLKPEDIYDRVK